VKENKVTEIKLLVPGKDLFAKRQCKSFEEATDDAVEALRRQIRKQRDKTRAH
jgi:putative sigma-54 modulation protein